ncbi:MAG: HINT domain-containing protein [Planctomycetes bacterium]|nr:HINT domain-containing protein [Planctomycetota bacterium]
MLSAGEDSTTTATNIEDIEVGDLVWARNESTGEEGFKPVVRLFHKSADTLVHLSYRREPGARGTGARSASDGSDSEEGGDAEDGDGQSGSISGTTEHPFWSVTRNNWVPMGELKAGERLLLAGSQTATATAIRIEHLATPVTVFNFEVADWHTYHVGTNDTGWVFVHNKCVFRGGAFRDLAKSGRIHRHHLPANKAIHVTTRGEGPAIQMLKSDHINTSSYGSPDYVQRIEKLLNKDQWRKAFAMEIRDVRRVARESANPRRYNSAIREMMAYSRKLGLPLGR